MNLAITLCLLLQAVVGVFIEDAFTKNWVNYNHGRIKQFDLVAADELVAVSENNEIIKFRVDFESEKVTDEWKVRVPFEFSFVKTETSIFAYNKEYIYIYDIASGALNNYYKAAVTSLHPAFSGALAVTDKGVVFVGGPEVVEIPGLDAVRDMFVGDADDVALLFTDSSAFIKLPNNFSAEQIPVDIKFGKVNEVKGSLAATGDGVFDLVANEFVNKVKNLKIHDSDKHIFYSYAKGDLKVYHKKELVLSDKFDNVQLLGDKIVGSKQGETIVLDVSKFYQTFDESSIVLDTYNSTIQEGKYFVVDNTVFTVAVGEHINITKYDPVKDVAKDYTFRLQKYSLNSKAVLINKPESEQTMESIQHLIDEINQNGLVTRWLKRTKRHLVELGKFAVSFVKKVELDKIVVTNPYDIEKLLVYVDGTNVVAVDSLDGEFVWSQEVETGVIDLVEGDAVIEVIYKDKVVGLSARDGAVVFSKQSTVTYSEGFTYIKQDGNAVQSYRVIDGNLTPGWKYTYGEVIRLVVKPANQHASVGIPLHDKSVLYKYLNDQLVAVLTSNKGTLVLSVLDGKSGSVIYRHVHQEPELKVDYDSINVAMDDNWIIYSYFVNSPKFEQRITVVDLFEGKSAVEGSTKTYIYPERILNMVPTYTRFGITTKSIIVFTASGDLIEVPKYILNSRRIDDKVLSQDDSKDDFRMSPYEPVVPRNNYQVLNHQYKLDVGAQNQILVKDTKLESTSVVCLLNEHNKFCTQIQPSLSFDILGDHFDKFKLIITMIVLTVIYFITKPMVIKKNLNNQWVYAT